MIRQTTTSDRTDWRDPIPRIPDRGPTIRKSALQLGYRGRGRKFDGVGMGQKVPVLVVDDDDDDDGKLSIQMLSIPPTILTRRNVVLT
jgi:hypothetical protein